jgi:hypothetical protein
VSGIRTALAAAALALGVLGAAAVPAQAAAARTARAPLTCRGQGVDPAATAILRQGLQAWLGDLEAAAEARR